MYEKTKEVDFDIAIVGCGAYGFPLASRLKEDGKIAIALGGLVQLLFGIKGRRWDNSDLYNEHWVRPSARETPVRAGKTDGGAYW
jgi:hypothetical protein